MCVFFLLFSQSISSSVSVVFVFSASLNDVAPVSPIMLAVDMTRNEKKLIVDGCHLRVFFLFVFTSQIEFRECCV